MILTLFRVKLFRHETINNQADEHIDAFQIDSFMLSRSHSNFRNQFAIFALLCEYKEFFSFIDVIKCREEDEAEPWKCFEHPVLQSFVVKMKTWFSALMIIISS